MSGDNKMKGLLKGLRIISQIFDNEKETEIEIGHPTDVKHVAHIGLDGPTENPPTWMNEFKSVRGLSSSAPLNMNGDIRKRPDDSEPRVSLDSMRKGSRSVNVEEDTHELPLPKSSKQHSHSSGNMRESHAKEKSDKPRQPKKHSKHSTPNNDSFNESKLTTTEQIRPMDTNSLQLQGTTNDNLPPRNQPEIPKRTYSKKTKDIQGVGGSSKARSKAQPKEPDSGEGTHSRSSSKSKESNSNEGSHSRSSFKSKDPNANEGSHSRTGSKSRDPDSKEGPHSRTGSKSRDPDSKEGPHSRSGSKSKNLNSNEGQPSRHDAKSKSKHRLSEDGQLERGSNEDLLRKYTN